MDVHDWLDSDGELTRSNPIVPIHSVTEVTGNAP
jgi:hypothetical protein